MGHTIQPLNFPKIPDLKMYKKGQDIFIFDSFRKKNIKLTPEEWVRQHLLNFLVNEKSYPAAKIGVEYMVKVDQLTRRCDAIVFDDEWQPLLLIECKEPAVKLTNEVLYQVAQYNKVVNVKKILISNGLEHLMLDIVSNQNKFMLADDFPRYHEIG
ncbi:MAG: type I restriction enzyme HsdR N-terminal domain-containing protein [Crocinitomicaceae bacterium]|nr:type I restriction enzyme HsdR N-terminal domain-containing protein [Crocinitomicaceae bacterium]